MISITATSEKAPQTIHEQTVNGPTNGSWWSIRLVGWIYQQAGSTTLNVKWQVGAHDYYPYWNDSHDYTVTIGDKNITDSFALPSNTSNSYIDKSSVKSITISHEGAYSGSITITGYKCWEYFSFTDTISFPAVSSGGGSTPTQTSFNGIQVINDTDPRYYVFADDEILYSMNDENRYLLNMKLSLEINQVDQFDFTVPPTNILYSKLLRLKTTIEVRQGSEILFRGRILTEDIDFNNMKSIHCEGALSFLGDTLLEPYKEDKYTTAEAFFSDALTQHYNAVPASTPKRRLVKKNCTVSANITTSNETYSRTSDAISWLLDNVGGFIKLNYLADGTTEIYYLNSLGHTSSQIIDFGDNLIDISMSIDTSDICTAVLVEGGKDTDTEVREHVYLEDAESIKTYGKIVRTYTYDDIVASDDMTAEEASKQLNAMALYQLLLGTKLTMTVSAKAIDLHLVYPEYEKIRVGDNVRLRTRPHNIDSYFQCVSVDIDPQHPENNIYTFGAVLPAITDTTKKR